MTTIDGKRLVAVVQTDEPVYDLLLLPDGMDVEAERAAWMEWRATEYASARRSGKPIAFVTFAGWLLAHGAAEAPHEKIEAP